MSTSSDKKDELEGTEAPFVSHLVELRDRLESTLALQGESARPNARAVAKLTADIAAVNRYLEEGE